MRQAIVTALIAFASLAAWGAVDNPVARFVPLSAPDCPGPANLIAEDAVAPSNATYLRVQHIGDPGTDELAGEVRNGVTWNAGELTGFDARGIPGAQRGFRDEGLPVGTSVFQLACNRAGFLINTWQFSHAAPLTGEGPSVSIARNFDPPLPAFVNGASLLLEADVRLPWILNQAPPVSAGTAQLSFMIYARDTRGGAIIAQLVQLFDNRTAGVGGSGIESLGNDGQVAFASSPLAPADSRGSPVRFVTVAPASPQMQYAAPWSESRHFRALVTYANFHQLLEALRAGPLPSLSPEPSDYQLLLFGVLGEVFPGPGSANNVSFGGSVSDLSLREIPRWSPAPQAKRRASR